MNLLLTVLVLGNIFWSIYLTYLFYKRFSHSKKPSSLPVDTMVKPFKFQLNRYNPFDEVGGDQSFILCLLDNTNSGVIITSLHNRDSTRVYAKAIHNGDSVGQKMSKEEIKTLLKTISN